MQVAADPPGWSVLYTAISVRMLVIIFEVHRSDAHTEHTMLYERTCIRIRIRHFYAALPMEDCTGRNNLCIYYRELKIKINLVIT